MQLQGTSTDGSMLAGMLYSNPMNPMFSPQVSLLPQHSMLGPDAEGLIQHHPAQPSGRSTDNPLFGDG